MNVPHPLVQAWCPLDHAPRAGRVVPSDEGLRLLRREGHRGLRGAIRAWAERVGMAADAIEFAGSLESAALDGAATGGCHEPTVLAIHPAGRCALAIRLAIPVELSIFNGHFPTVPIVPGAQLAGWAALLAGRHGPWRHGLRAAQVLKFRRIVQPGHEPDLHLSWNEAVTRLEFRYEREAALHAQGVLLAP